MVQVIDTNLVPSWKRAEYLYDAVEQSPLPVINLSRSRFKDSGFRARLSGKMLGDAFITRFDASALQLTRAEREISKRSSGMLLLALLDHGTYEQLFDYRAPLANASPGDFLLLDLDAPQSVTFADAATICAYIPRSHFEPFLDSRSFVAPVVVRPHDELYGLLAACFRECVAMREPTAAAARGALATLTRVALVVRGMHPRDDADLSRSVAEARRYKAQQFITAHCCNPRLDAQKVADHLKLSLRSLHLAFEPTGQGVAARILAARLAHARGMLVDSPQSSTLDVALACGFNNLSTFYHGFSQAYGMPPGEFRKSRN